MGHITIFCPFISFLSLFRYLSSFVSLYSFTQSTDEGALEQECLEALFCSHQIYLLPILQSIRCICIEIRLLLYLGNSIYVSTHSNRNNPMQSKCCRHNNVHADHISPDTIGKMEADVRHPNTVPVLARFSVPSVHHTSCFL